MELRYGKREDIDEWMSLVLQIREFFPALAEEDQLTEHKKTVLDFMDRGQAVCAIENNRIQGIILFSKDENMIKFLGVSPDTRKGGIGSLLLTEAMKNLDSTKEISVITFREGDPKGIAPRALYRKFGFIPGRLTDRCGYPKQELFIKPVKETDKQK